jgi:hypothetical protein
MKALFVRRLSEPSTWAGIAALIAAGAQAAATRDPSAIGAVIGGAMAILLPEKKAP